MLVVVVGHRWSSMVNTLAEGAGNLLFFFQAVYNRCMVLKLSMSYANLCLCFQTSVSSVSQQVQFVSVCF